MSAALAHPDDFPADQLRRDAQTRLVGGDPSTEQARLPATPNAVAPARPTFPADQLRRDAHGGSVGGETNSELAKRHATPISHAPARAIVPAHQKADEAHVNGVGGDPNSEQAKNAANTTGGSPARANVPADHGRPDTQDDGVGGDPNSDGHTSTDAHGTRAAAPPSPDPASVESAPMGTAPGPGTPAPEQAILVPTPIRHAPARAPLPPAPAIGCASPTPVPPVLAETDSQRGSARGPSTPSSAPLSLADPLLALAADVLDDIEKVLNANRNRARLLTTPTDTPDKDGECRGLGFPTDHPYVALITASVDALAAAEEQATKHLKRMFRPHQLRPWQRRQRGIGEKQLARLLAVIGDPYWNSASGQPRTVSQLWAYCGYRPGQRRRKGEKSKWSTKAKSRAYLIAEKCMINLVKPCARPDGQAWAVHVDGCQCSPYRLVYDRVREQKAGSVHHEDCNQCGPRGKPAPAGSPRSENHLKTMALRVAAKTILRDLWREAKRIHDEHADQ